MCATPGGHPLSERLRVRVTDVADMPGNVRCLELQPAEGALPPFRAGAHIDLMLPNGLVRSYSLMNSESERHRYQIAVALEPASRGGSAFVHHSVAKGDRLTISAPRNLFPLNESARHSVLLGGGIGITPMLSMAKRLGAIGASWQLLYCCRSRAVAAFADEVAGHAPHAAIRCDDEQSRFLDFASLMREHPRADFYCCGPKAMMAAFTDAARSVGLPSDRVHMEYFQPPEESMPTGGFLVELARQRRTLAIPQGSSILEVLQAEGITATSSCEQGICGECAVKVLAGVPDHKDYVLSDAEQAANNVMMICCSGSKSEKLVLDI